VLAATEDKEKAATGTQNSGDLGDGGLGLGPEVEIVDREHRVLRFVTDWEPHSIPSMERCCAAPDELGVAAPGQTDHLLGDVHTGDSGTEVGKETEGAPRAEADLEDVLTWTRCKEVPATQLTRTPT
jgi:hypothetical protein